MIDKYGIDVVPTVYQNTPGVHFGHWDKRLNFSVNIGVGNFSLFDRDEIRKIFDAMLTRAIEFADKVKVLEKNKGLDNDCK